MKGDNIDPIFSVSKPHSLAAAIAIRMSCISAIPYSLIVYELPVVLCHYIE